MKIKILTAIFIILSVLCFYPKTVYATQTSTGDIDKAILDVLNGIDEESFSELTELLNSISGTNKTFKEWIIDFITGEYSFDLSSVKSYFISLFSSLISNVASVMACVIFIGILCGIINTIISKNSDNNEKSIVNYICLLVIISLLVGVVSTVFNFASQAINGLSKTVELTFPLLITLVEFTGGFGLTAVKPFMVIVSFISSTLSSKLLLPLLSFSAVTVIVSNVSTSINLNSLNKTILSLVKWCLGITTAVLTVVITGQSVVNMQYNGISFKILKYATGSLIPIVGGFISGGLDVVLSSAVLVKNAFGLLASAFIFLTLGIKGITVLITSLIMRFTVSVAEPILDRRFTSIVTGISEVFNHLSAVIFVCGFSFVLVCISVISTTALIS